MKNGSKYNATIAYGIYQIEKISTFYQGIQVKKEKYCSISKVEW